MHNAKLMQMYTNEFNENVERLRYEHRIVGYLTGTLTRFPMQNGFYGLPLVLLPEQVEFLLKKGNSLTYFQRKAVTDHQYIYPIKNTLFEYFWSLDYFITGGSKFGGDYLLYPGDPSGFHSQFIVSAIDEPFSGVDIVSMGRLATNVKKAFVLAGIIINDEEKETEDQVVTFSIEWAGF
ncbi:tRNA-intron endonuclease catalytic domain-like protein [Backusella circina FSU 941]|nr:tRNA-intron endonuclease catalytic domain-like protein [Backusella circina FSU 941]